MKYLRTFLLLAFSMLTFASAQINDMGFQLETDDFTGEVSCTHIVSNTADANYTSVNIADAGTPIFGIYRYNLEADEIAHNMFSVTAGDTLYLRFDNGDVETYEIAQVGADVTEGELTWQSFIAAVVPKATLERMISATAPVRFRIDSTSDYDGALSVEQLNALQGYFEKCKR